jgi:predicted metal-dependent phosphoesterase TrpH
MGIDLHTHSRRSDGTTTPAENAALAAAEGLDGLALTDHDTVDGWQEAAGACAGHGLRFVPGVELSTEDRGLSVHLLGYWVDPEEPRLAAECARLRDERRVRAARILARLEELGAGVDAEAVGRIAGVAPVGRPHIAQAMVDAGVVGGIDEAFDRYLADGGPAWVVKHAVTPEDGVRLIRGAGGAAVLAHPALHDPDPERQLALLERLCAAGLAGVEADHAGHGPPQRAYWRRVATERNLLVTGSSDFHGARKEAKIGASTTPVATVEALQERATAAMTAGGRESW